MMPKPNTSQRLNNLPSNIEAISYSVLWSSEDRLQVTLLMVSLTGPEQQKQQQKKSIRRAQHAVPLNAQRAMNVKNKHTILHKYPLENKQGDTNRHKQYKHESLSLSGANMS